MERTKGALEEREFLIRRLERSESNNANVLGRIQTSIERLGSIPVGAGAGAGAGAGGRPASDWSAELIRIDGERPVTHVLSRRTRIGRATGCELQIDSGSVSRHHALIMVGPRESVIEDLNSTNGVLVNGRKVSRQVLCDGDAVTIGETQFRYIAQAACRASAEQATPRRRPARERDFSPEIRYLSRPSSALSSAVEHHLDMVVVSGSIPLARTILMAGCRDFDARHPVGSLW